MDKQDKKNTINNNSGEIIIYEGKDGLPRIEAQIKDETVWLSQKQMAELFDCSVDNVSLHFKKHYFKRR